MSVHKEEEVTEEEEVHVEVKNVFNFMYSILLKRILL